jgi:NADPH:quinone reductase-like Zn-dependent oxidoreductase
MAGLTALIAAREQGRIQPGQRVLVNGASGGVGMFALQIARTLGATVTGVCGPQSVDFVRELGAHEVVDYSAQDFTRAGQRYDVLLDIAGRHGARACRWALTKDGTLVAIGGPAGRWLQPAGHIFATLATGPLASQRIVLADTLACAQKPRLLAELAELVEGGKIAPVIDRDYPFEQLPQAVAYQEQGHARGKVVVTI